jgi:exportin-T
VFLKHSYFRGIHNPNTHNRGRLFYLFHRFIKDVKSEVSPHDVPPLLNSIGDLLSIQVELPELESPEQDVLQVAVEQPTLFDSQLYLFETVGTLISLMGADQPTQTSLLQVRMRRQSDIMTTDLYPT